jgi:cytochrome c biogenesis protein CcmG/thiol:disulfide interchange protein DsbE
VQVLREQQYRLISVTLDAKPDPEDLLGKLFIGAPAPALNSLRAVQGSVVPSVSPGGSVRVIEFWASWCMACRALGPTLNQWQQELQVLGVELLGITMDPFEQAANAARQLGMEYPIFVDESGDVTRAYQGTALPTLFVVDRAGIVRSVTVGYNPARFTETRALIKTLALAPAHVNPSLQIKSAAGK